MTHRTSLLAAFRAGSASATSRRISARAVNKTELNRYLLMIWLILLLAITGLFGFALNHTSAAKAGMPALAGKEALSYLQNEGLLSSLQTEFKKLTASDGEESDEASFSVAISGDTVVVGAFLDDVGNNPNQGSAYVFERNAGGVDNWGEVRMLTASDGAAEDQFGVSVAISGDRIIVGAASAEVGNNFRQGSAYIFERNAGGANNWGEVRKLAASDGDAEDFFGVSVVISGDTIIVGSPGDNTGNNPNQGSAYIFERNAGGTDNWGETKKLAASDGEMDDFFGFSVAISGDTVVVGAFLDDSGNSRNQGSAYIFSRNAGGADNWGETKKLIASDGEMDDQFGISVAISGDTVIVGCPGGDVVGNIDQGSAYIFSRNAGGADNWGEVRKLAASDGTADDLFGVSVAISGDTVIVGAFLDDVGNNLNQGSAYVFERNRGGANNWGEVRKLTASDGEFDDQLGFSVAISGETAIVGAPRDDVGNNPNQGSAHIFLNLDVPAPLFDFCLQDDSAKQRQLAFNSQTGEYLFCDGVVLTGGTGVITRKGNTLTLTHITGDRRLLASVTAGSFGSSKGSASLQMIAAKRTYSITDRDTSNNKCDCGAQ